MPSCVLCQGKQIFYFTPKFPDHLKHIAQRLDLCVPKACPCPFCCDVQPAADYECVKQENSKAKNVSWTDEHPVEYLKGAFCDAVIVVSVYSASLLIKNHGYPPDIAVKALFECRNNLLEAAKEAERLLSDRLELLQLVRIESALAYPWIRSVTFYIGRAVSGVCGVQRVLQDTSLEERRTQTARNETEIEQRVLQGDCAQIKSVYPEFYDSVCVKSLLVSIYLEPHTVLEADPALAESAVTTLPCFCKTVLLAEKRPITELDKAKVCGELRTLLLNLGQKRRLGMYRLLRLLRNAEKWYKTPAIYFSQRLQRQWASRMFFLDLCIERNEAAGWMNQRVSNTVPQNVDTQLSVGQIQSLFTAGLLLQTWIARVYCMIQQGLYTPNFQNLLALPPLFDSNYWGDAQKTGAFWDPAKQLTATDEADSRCTRTATGSPVSVDCTSTPENFLLLLCCRAFVSHFVINPELWERQDNAFWDPLFSEVIGNSCQQSDCTKTSSINETLTVEEDVQIVDDGIKKYQHCYSSSPTIDVSNSSPL